MFGWNETEIEPKPTNNNNNKKRGSQKKTPRINLIFCDDQLLFWAFVCAQTHRGPQSINIHHKNVLCIKTRLQNERGLKFNRQQNIVPGKIDKAMLYGLALAPQRIELVPCALCPKAVAILTTTAAQKLLIIHKKWFVFVLVSFSLAYFTFHQRNKFLALFYFSLLFDEWGWSSVFFADILFGGFKNFSTILLS